jgi:hypothetical protein
MVSYRPQPLYPNKTASDTPCVTDAQKKTHGSCLRRASNTVHLCTSNTQLFKTTVSANSEYEVTSQVDIGPETDGIHCNSRHLQFGTQLCVSGTKFQKTPPVLFMPLATKTFTSQVTPSVAPRV